MAGRILVIDDESAILETLQILLRGEGFEVEIARGGKEALDRLDAVTPDLVVSDIRMPGVTGLDLLSTVRERDPEMPVILMTAQASLQSAIQAVNHGAFYYLQKPFSNAELVALCRRAVEARTLKRENLALKREIRRRDRGQGARPVGKSRAFVELMRVAETVAPTDSTVLITGESGTGKEILARYIHSISEREAGPFISVNCGALPETLLESELFGHVKGSFTGAVKDKEGLLAAARGGTFFLDEVGETSPSLQVKLLRALQEREIVPVGATQPVPIDVRIIAATNRDLEHEIRHGSFRTDLYYRLNVISLHMPPLRERVEDIPLLAEHFLERFAGAAKAGDAAARARDGGPQARDGGPPGGDPGTGEGPRRRGRDREAGGGRSAAGRADAGPAEDGGGRRLRLSEETLAALQRYDWPGNVRELENALERAAVLTRTDLIEASALPASILEPPVQALVSERAPPNPSLEVIERAYILWVLQAEGGNKARTAEVLGIDPSTLYRKLNRYGFE